MRCHRRIRQVIAWTTLILSGCTIHQPLVDHRASASKADTVTPSAATQPTAPTTSDASSRDTPATPTVMLSPYSTDGLQALSQYRDHNSALNEFLLRNRKPDYFFSSGGEYTDQKIFLVYLANENLYVFDTVSSVPYKKFHPLPESIQQSLKDIAPPPFSQTESTSSATRRSSHRPGERHAVSTTPSTIDNNTTTDLRSDNEQNDIEQNLSDESPQPYLQTSLLNAIPLTPDSMPTDSDLYFLDVPLSELLDNDYSMKFDAKRQTLKLIFPKSYNAAALYQDKSVEARKLFVVRPQIGTGNSPELSLIVPDFLPGSSLYQNTHGAMRKVFASLYQVKMPTSFSETHRLRMRYRLKLCQADAIKTCAVSEDNTRSVRAIVIAATLYDSNTGTVIETFVLK